MSTGSMSRVARADGIATTHDSPAAFSLSENGRTRTTTLMRSRDDVENDAIAWLSRVARGAA